MQHPKAGTPAALYFETASSLAITLLHTLAQSDSVSAIILLSSVNYVDQVDNSLNNSWISYVSGNLNKFTSFKIQLNSYGLGNEDF